MTGKSLTAAQKAVLAVAFAPMLATGVAGGIGTYTNIAAKYGDGTAVGAVAAGEGAVVVLALVLLGLTMLGQSAPAPIRIGLWLLPAGASAMALTAASGLGQQIVYALTPMGMTVAAEGMAFLARRIVVHVDGRDSEAEAHAAAVVRELAYHRARATHHPTDWVRKASERRSWRLARRVGRGDAHLAARLLDVQRVRVQSGADAALADMFGGTPIGPTPILPTSPHPELEAPSRNAEESTESTANRSCPDQDEHPNPTPPESGAESAPDQATDPAPVGPDSDPTPDPADTPGSPGPVPVKSPVTAKELVVAAEAQERSRVTGRIPESARTTTRPKRTRDQLLTEAREITADWSTKALTANSIRLALRTSSENARTLRDTLKAERATATGSSGDRAAA